MSAEVPWVVLRRADLEELLDAAMERGRALARDDAWMTAQMVAELLGVKRETVTTYVRRQGLPCRWAGSRPVFRRDEVTAWLEARVEKPRSRAVRDGRILRGLKGGKV